MNKKNIWMEIAFREAEKAYQEDEVPIGAIIVKDDKIIGRGYNQIESLNDSTAHAEIIAITCASNHLNGWRLNDCSIYVTKEPCIMCYGAIKNSRIHNVYYGAVDLEKGFRQIVEDGDLFLDHIETVESGIMEEKCKSIIQDFFRKKRKKNDKSFK